MPKRMSILMAVVVVLAAGCGSRSGTKQAPAPERTDEISRTFDVGGGQKLFLECSGTGTPTILLEAGDESGTEDWRLVDYQLAEKTRTCAYDRAGNGQSDPATGCRGIDDLLGDLEALLGAAKIKGPYVLVGASGGGFLMAEFAARHPADVSGLVLAEVPKAITMMDDQLKADLKCDAPRNIEHRDYYAVEHAAWDVRKKIGDFPMTIISNQYPDGLPPGDEVTNVQDQRGWLILSPESKQVVVTSGHDVTENESTLVVQEILAVLKASRAG